jgi:hypothetical protein
MPDEPPSGEQPPIDTGRKKDGTFAPGHKSTGGRPLGARSKATAMLDAVLFKNMKAATDVLVREALAGQHWALTLMLRDQMPRRVVSFALPKLASAADAPAAIREVLERVAEGGLTVEDGDKGAPNDNFGILGYVIVFIFIASWLLSYVLYKYNRYDEVEASTA